MRHIEFNDNKWPESIAGLKGQGYGTKVKHMLPFECFISLGNGLMVGIGMETGYLRVDFEGPTDLCTLPNTFPTEEEVLRVLNFVNEKYGYDLDYETDE